MQLEVSDSEEALNITGDNLSGDEYYADECECLFRPGDDCARIDFGRL